MEAVQEAMRGITSGNTFFYVLVGLAIAGLLAGFAYVIISMRKTIPTGFEDMAQNTMQQTQMKEATEGGEEPDEEEAGTKTEGFYGGVARGAGIPDCFQSSTAAAKLFSMFQGRVGSFEEGTPDLQEFNLLLSQMACFKKDLVGVANVVDATRYQPFATQIDMEPIAETTARCFAKTIPKRDLTLIFDKFKTRGNFLITRLCTAANLSEEEVTAAEMLYKSFLADVQDIAESKCLSGEPTINAAPISPREPVPSTPDGIGELRPYHGYY